MGKEYFYHRRLENELGTTYFLATAAYFVVHTVIELRGVILPSEMANLLHSFPCSLLEESSVLRLLSKVHRRIPSVN
jgi:hypothetical protein